MPNSPKPEATALPTAAQFDHLNDLPHFEGAVREYTDARRATLVELEAAGWVFWSGSGGWSSLHATPAGKGAIARYRDAQRKSRQRKAHARRMSKRGND